MNQAPKHALDVSQTDRVRLTKYQSLKKYQNPYGDYANELLNSLNVAWKARIIIASMLQLDPLLEQQFQNELRELNQKYKEIIAYLELHKIARPYQFDRFNGYSYIDLSSTNWEGHFSNL